MRTKAKIRDARIPYQVPSGEELPERLEAVLQVIYLVFNEGYSASSGESLTRPDLSGEAIRLGRLLVELQPEPEAARLPAKGGTAMQFMAYDPNYDPQKAGPPPSPEFMAEMGQFIGEATQAGAVVTTGSLHPEGKRLRLSGGKFSVTDGPSIELKELTGGYAVIQADSVEEAIEWCKRFRKILGEGVTEIVQVFGPDDYPPA